MTRNFSQPLVASGVRIAFVGIAAVCLFGLAGCRNRSESLRDQLVDASRLPPDQGDAACAAIAKRTENDRAALFDALLDREVPVRGAALSVLVQQPAKLSSFDFCAYEAELPAKENIFTRRLLAVFIYDNVGEARLALDQCVWRDGLDPIALDIYCDNDPRDVARRLANGKVPNEVLSEIRHYNSKTPQDDITKALAGKVSVR
jgi:hypothetical protein